MGKGIYLCANRPGHKDCLIHNLMLPLEQYTREMIARIKAI